MGVGDGGTADRGISERQFMVLEYEVRDRIAYITLNRPRAMNAMNQELKEKLADAIEQVGPGPGCLGGDCHGGR